MQENDYMIKGIRKGCQKEFPVDDTLVDELGSNRFPEDKNLMVNSKWFGNVSNWILNYEKI